MEGYKLENKVQASKQLGYCSCLVHAMSSIHSSSVLLSSEEVVSYKCQWFSILIILKCETASNGAFEVHVSNPEGFQDVHGMPNKPREPSNHSIGHPTPSLELCPLYIYWSTEYVPIIFPPYTVHLTPVRQRVTGRL